MLAHRLQRLSNIKPALDQHLVFTEHTVFGPTPYLHDLEL